MLIDLQEFRTGALKTARLNRVLNVIEGTTLITPISQNGPHRKRRYSDAALKQIAVMAEGLPAYANHTSPDLAFKPRDVRDLIGRHHNVRYLLAEGKVVSDLHVLEHHAPWVLGLAERLGDVVGNSLVSRGAVTMEGDTEVVTEIALLRSADLVSDPASTKGLFESLDVWPPSLAPHPWLGPHPHARLRAALLGQPFVTLEAMTEAHRAARPRPAPPGRHLHHVDRGAAGSRPVPPVVVGEACGSRRAGPGRSARAADRCVHEVSDDEQDREAAEQATPSRYVR